MHQARVQGNVPAFPQPLAADFTAARQLALDRGFLKGFSLTGLLYPEKVLEESRLYQLEPYDPNRIPVVFVHGLMSDPHIWFNCVNAIYADPQLRARYQPWYFLYPTGMAVPSTAARLRESLNDMRNRLDPDHNDPGMNRMVLVGHSMGGLLGRLQTTDSGDAFWNAYFQKQPEELLLSEDSRTRLVSRLKFERQPYVSRLIFIAVPHRGSELADKGLVMRLAKLIRLPIDTLLLATELMSGNVNALNPQIRDWGAYAFLSLGTLSPRHPYLTAMNSKPVAVPHHSIIGKVGDGPLKDSSDRVVPYSSSHLPTGSEKIVSWWHGCVEHPEVVAEVTRRLHEHLASSGRK
jgi:pimeloyl-ACP methyl ester carboxylesterase